MAGAASQWRLWDFGSSQVARNATTGQTLKVFGEGSCFANGPFSLVHDVAFPGKPILVGLEGDDETRAMHFLDEQQLATATLSTEEAEPYVVWPSTGDKPMRRGPISEFQSQRRYQVLEFQDVAGKKLILEFTLCGAPIRLQDESVSQWMGLERVVDYLFEGIANENKGHFKAARYITRLKADAEKAGLDSGHFTESLDTQEHAQKRRRLADVEENVHKDRGASTTGVSKESCGGSVKYWSGVTSSRAKTKPRKPCTPSARVICSTSYWNGHKVTATSQLLPSPPRKGSA